MAKKVTEGSGKIKFRFVEFEMDGADGSLEEGLKSIAAALSRGLGPANAAQRLLRSDGARTPAGDTPEPEDIEDAELEDVTPASSSSTGKTRSTRKVSTRKILEDFKLDDVEPTLREFATVKDPKTDIRKYLVIAYWAKTYKKMEELTPDHFFTAYRALGWGTPKDPVQPIRDLTNPRNGKFSAGTSPGNGKINHIGEQTVIDMGKGA